MIILSGATVIDPGSSLESKQDVLIEQGRIQAIDSPGSFHSKKQAEVVDLTGKWLVPGLIDIHVHLREPGFEWKETIASGSAAAVSGGFTRVCSMPNTEPCADNAEVTRFIIDRARAAGLARVHPIGAVSVARKGLQLAPLLELAEAGCVAFSDDGDPVWDALLMRRALEWSSAYGFPIAAHEEVKELTACGSMNESALSLQLGLNGMPACAEDIMIARDIELARMTGGYLHICHISSGRSVEMVRRAKQDHINVTVEVTPHHLHCQEDCVGEYDTNYKMSPPLRSAEDRAVLLEGLKDGTIDAIASDHAPHEADSKLLEFEKAAFGILGLQTTLPLTLELIEQGVIDRLRAIELLTSGPARCFKLEAGRIQLNAPADLTVIDPEYEWQLESAQILSKSKNTPFLGRRLKGRAVQVYVAGQKVFDVQERR